MKNILICKLGMSGMDWIAIGKMYLAGILGAMTVYGVMYFHKENPCMIGAVNITGIVDQFVKQESAKNLPPEKLEMEIRKFGKTLESELKQFALENHLVLFPAEAVIAGSRDYTRLVRDEMNKKINHGELPDAG